jgi:hypothetical protein
VEDSLVETVRLRGVLRSLRIAVDVIAMSQERFDYWKDTPNTLAYRVMKEGKVYEQVA